MVYIWSNTLIEELARILRDVPPNISPGSSAVAAKAPIEEPAKAPDWTLSGALDFYHGWSRPRVGVGPVRIARQFDIRNEQLQVATAQVTIKYRPDKEGFGFSLTPCVGDHADILFGYDRTSSLWVKHLAEAFGTYKKKNLTIDLGKFYSWIGWEGVEVWNNDLYSRALLYTIVQPNYHTGLRATYAINDNNTVSLYATKGWNQTSRHPKGLTYGAQYKRVIDPKTTAYLGFITGKEGSVSANNSGTFGGIAFLAPGVLDTTLFDFILTREHSAKWRFSFNATSAKAGGNKFYGASGVVRYQVNPKTAVALRAETVGDDRGIRFGTPAHMSSLTLGVDYALSPQTTARFDLRNDSSNVALFPRIGGTTAKTQTTFNLGIVVRF